ncbi:MAG: hypothetical protein ACP5C3_08825 [Methanomicrobiales archaeon]
MVNNSNMEMSYVIDKLKNLDNHLDIHKNSSIAWVTFPYSPENLDNVKKSLIILNWSKNDYNLNFDENLIFIEKDIYDK